MYLPLCCEAYWDVYALQYALIDRHSNRFRLREGMPDVYMEELQKNRQSDRSPKQDPTPPQQEVLNRDAG